MILDFTMRQVLVVMLVGAVLLSVVLYLFGRFVLAQISFTVNITINPASVPLSAVSDPLNLTGQVGQPFSASLAANVQGGKPPYTLNVTGTLPDGITNDGSGNLGGIPTTAGTTTLNVSASDSAS